MGIPHPDVHVGLSPEIPPSLSSPSSGVSAWGNHADTPLPMGIQKGVGGGGGRGGRRRRRRGGERNEEASCWEWGGGEGGGEREGEGGGDGEREICTGEAKREVWGEYEPLCAREDDGGAGGGGEIGFSKGEEV